MRRSAVARHSLPPAAAAALGFGVAPPRALQSLAMAAAATTSPPLGSCLPPCHRRRSSMCSSASSAASSASAAATTALAVEEARRGRKQLGMEPPLYDYLLANVREHPILRDLREETAAMRGSQMQVSPAQAQLLAMLVQILGAQRCIEVGVFTGYSSLAVALALPESGRLVACERDERCLEVAKRYYRLAGVAHKVDVKHALAVDSLKSLLESGEASSYDFAFVDADKKMYEEYFELLLKLVRVGGLIVMDNVLWYGRVADPLVNDPKTISIRDFNKKLLEDTRVNISMVPIGDGMTICRKLEDD
ncbi:O-methyltransferase MdmC-like [Lolium rigidum]|uniref:O-methyltransferase MdmC-like n=1 Tax=Lolium rigidum TaxID=89674 RepID=UPI001F5E0BB4|nr:O-methyltransferase MdmC-like [Lolium rigidum]